MVKQKTIKNNKKKMIKKTRHEGDESTVSFWLYMKALYKDDENN